MVVPQEVSLAEEMTEAVTHSLRALRRQVSDTMLLSPVRAAKDTISSPSKSTIKALETFAEMRTLATELTQGAHNAVSSVKASVEAVGSKAKAAKDYLANTPGVIIASDAAAVNAKHKVTDKLGALQPLTTELAGEAKLAIAKGVWQAAEVVMSTGETVATTAANTAEVLAATVLGTACLVHCASGGEGGNGGNGGNHTVVPFPPELPIKSTPDRPKKDPKKKLSFEDQPQASDKENIGSSYTAKAKGAPKKLFCDPVQQTAAVQQHDTRQEESGNKNIVTLVAEELGLVPLDNSDQVEVSPPHVFVLGEYAEVLPFAGIS